MESFDEKKVFNFDKVSFKVLLSVSCLKTCFTLRSDRCSPVYSNDSFIILDMCNSINLSLIS